MAGENARLKDSLSREVGGIPIHRIVCRSFLASVATTGSKLSTKTMDTQLSTKGSHDKWTGDGQDWGLGKSRHLGQS